jgi:hypothetical protein
MRGVRWTPEQDAILRRRYPHEVTKALVEEIGCTVLAIYRRANDLGLRKTPEYLSSPAANRLDGSTGAACRFAKGQRPWNAGMKGWQSGGLSVTTQFKPGTRPHTWLPIGSERVTRDGILQRKLTDTGYTPRDWKAVHAIVWEQAHGRIPEGHIVVFKDGNRLNVCLDNLELLSRAENMRRNSVHRYPKEIVSLVRTRAVLVRQINKRERREKQDQ